MDTVSNGGFLQFSAGGILSPLPGELGPRLRSVRLRHPAQSERAIRLSVAAESEESQSRVRAQRLADFRDGVLAQRCSVLGSEHAVFREWERDCAGQRTAVRQRRSRRPAVRASSDSGVTPAGNTSVAQSRCLRVSDRVDPSNRAMCYGGDTRRIASSEASAATPCAVPIFSGATST